MALNPGFFSLANFLTRSLAGTLSPDLDGGHLSHPTSKAHLKDFDLEELKGKEVGALHCGA